VKKIVSAILVVAFLLTYAVIPTIASCPHSSTVMRCGEETSGRWSSYLYSPHIWLFGFCEAVIYYTYDEKWCWDCQEYLEDMGTHRCWTEHPNYKCSNYPETNDCPY